MRKVFLISLLALVLFSCAHTLTLSSIEDKWGPPGKIEKLDGKTIYYYYFQKGKASGLAIGSSSVTGLSGDYTEGVLVYKFTGDESGKVIKQRKYWKQPDMNK
jgi:hypothetical protein